MSTAIALSAKHIQSLKPAELPEDELVKNRFIQLHNNVTKSENGELIYHKELFNYKKMLAESPVLQKCTPLSLYGCFLDININMLSLEGGKQPDCYITPRNVNVGTAAAPQWESRAQLQVSPYGELKMRMRAGHIKYADNPVVVYEGDKLEVHTTGTGRTVNHMPAIPRTSNRIIASFIRLIRRDGAVDFFILVEEDIERMKAYSARQNKGSANALYSSANQGIDPGFLKAKTIKHAFQSYPKVKLGEFSAAESDEDTPVANDIYGIDPAAASANAVQDIPHTEVQDFKNAVDEHAAGDEPEAVSTVDDDDDLFN